MATVIPTLIFDPSVNGWVCKVAYNQDWINDLKFRIPGAARVWDKTRKVWVVDDMFIDTVRDICKKYFGSYKEIKNEAPPPPPPPPVIHNVSHFEDFLRLCPLEDVKALYRKAALSSHPDRNGGDSSKMTNLNVAWDRIKKDMGW